VLSFIVRYVVALVICWLPDRLNNIFPYTNSVLIEDAVGCRVWKMISYLLVILNNSINPLVYLIFTKKKRMKKPKNTFASTGYWNQRSETVLMQSPPR